MDSAELCRTWLRQKVYFLDTETTGLDEKAELVEIAVIDCEGFPVFERLIRPSVPITQKLTELHGISNDMVADAPLFSEIYGELIQKIGSRVLVAFGAEYDARIIRQTCDLYKLPALVAEWRCAMKMYQEHTGKTHRISLADAAAQSKVYNRKAHRARSDAETVLGIVQAVAGYRL